MSSSKLFIGGLSYNTDHQSLRAACSKYGYVTEDPEDLDFVKYSYEEEASSVMQALDGQYLHGRRVRVNYAADRARAGEGAGNYGGGNTGGGIVLTEILGSFSSDGNFNVSGYEGADNYGGGNTEGFNSSNYGVSGRGGVKVYKLEILGSETFQMKTVLTTEILESFSSDGVAGRGVKVEPDTNTGFGGKLLLTMKILGSFSSDGFKVSAGGGCTGGGFNGYRSAGIWKWCRIFSRGYFSGGIVWNFDIDILREYDTTLLMNLMDIHIVRLAQKVVMLVYILLRILLIVEDDQTDILAKRA
ncbi:hypothetical protein Patl1_19476 [Pistacia atlantica]|uniref:Uncharacterized protein n=1 Tax=Pistacia atlantica TaxID=434234 RepID=A0ACC1C233_9ROSI|nr:hypothetical protein Patl1_19476 [Pistacia atlantica]